MRCLRSRRSINTWARGSECRGRCTRSAAPSSAVSPGEVSEKWPQQSADNLRIGGAHLSACVCRREFDPPQGCCRLLWPDYLLLTAFILLFVFVSSVPARDTAGSSNGDYKIESTGALTATSVAEAVRGALQDK